MTEIIDAYCVPGTERDTRLNAEDLLRLMDEANICRAIISPEDREIIAHNVQGNQRMVWLAEHSGGRFIPSCSVNPWFGGEACREFRRAIDAGARMLVLAPALQGFLLGDELVDPLLAIAGKLGVPVYVHTGPHSYGAPSQVTLVAAKHPDTRFVIGHCGSTDFSYDMPAILGLALENVWFESSMVRPWAVADYVKQVDRRRFLFGSSAPRNDPAYELRHLQARLPIEEYPDIYGGNCAALLNEVS